MNPNYLASPTVWTLALGSLILTLIFTPWVIKLARSVGAVDRGGHRSVNKDCVPMMGGLAIAIPFIGVCVAGLFGASDMFGTIERHYGGLLVLTLGSIGIVILGAIDDMKGLGARDKFIGQITMALMTCLAGYGIHGVEIPLYGHLELSSFVGTGLTIVWIVGLTNAYNLIDGIDGLAAGLALIAAAGLAAISFMNGSTFPALMCVALCGSILGFLRYNFNPARIFLGDTGSMFLGYVLANITLMGSLKATGAVIFMAPVLVMGLPILDTMISVLRRYMRGRPLFVGDQGHIHHRLLKRGYSQRQAALTFYVIAGLMTVSAVIGWALPVRTAGEMLAYGAYAMTVLAVISIAGLRPSFLLQLTTCRKRNLLLNALSRYVGVRLGNQVHSQYPNMDEILRLICQELHLRYLRVIDETGDRLLICEQNDLLIAAGPECRIKVRIAGKQVVYLEFQPIDPMDELARTDFEACLASIFEHVRTGFAKPEPDLEPVPAIRTATCGELQDFSVLSGIPTA